MVDGQGQAGFVIPMEECVFDTKTVSNSFKSEPTLNSVALAPYAHNVKVKEFGEMLFVIQSMEIKFKDGSAETVALGSQILITLKKVGAPKRKLPVQN